MDEDPQPTIGPHLTPEARTRRRRLGKQFDRAASTIAESAEHAQAMLEELKRDPRYQPRIATPPDPALPDRQHSPPH